MIMVIVLVWIFLISPSVSAEEKVRLEEIIVTATRSEEPLGETTSGVALVTREDIRKMNVTFLPDVLRRIPELQVIQNGGPGKVASVLIRGGSSSHTLVMIDGIRVNSTTTGSYDFSGISVDDIERIEIVKGPQSTMYGSDAMAGVVSIITKKGKGRINTDFSLEAGSHETGRTGGTIDGSCQSMDYRLTAMHFQTDGISAAASGTERDGYRNSFFSGNLGFGQRDKARIEFTGRYSYDRSELDGFDFMERKAVDDRNFVQRGHHTLLAGRGIVPISDVWTQTMTASLAADSISFKDPDTLFNNAKIESEIRTLDWQHDITAAEYVSLVAGIEYREEKGDNHGNFDESLDNYALYLHNKLKLFRDVCIVTAGIRYDDRDTSGSKTTYRVGAMYYLPFASTTLRGSYGTAFRAPALNELFFPFYGKPDLKPEEIRSWEAAIETDFFDGRLHFSMTYFDQEYENLISTNPSTFIADNIADARIKGVEAGVSAEMSSMIKTRLGYAYLDSEDRKTGRDLPLRPQDKVTLSVELSGKDFTVLADFLFVGKRFDSSVKKRLSSYDVFNVSASYRVSKGLALFLRGENLFDEQYEEVGTFGTQEFSLYGGIRVSL